jgi:predicted DNA-binding transcriptional regulator YafY
MDATLEDTIKYCGQNQVLMTMTYNGTERQVEVYSYRSKNTGVLLFAYCYKDNKIESFRLDKIEHAKATTIKFNPKYPIEIG